MMTRSFLLAAALSAACLPALAAEESAAGVRELFEAHEHAFNSHNLEGVMKLYVPGDKTVLMGTGPGERWVGDTEIEDAYKHFFADFDAGTIKRDCQGMVGGERGDVGWLSATCDYQDSLKGKERSFALNVSVVLEKLDGAWKLRSMHFSNLTAP